MKNYDTIIIGGGASGLFCAINIKIINKNKSVLILEHGQRVGKKILSTGNGKCNLTNMNCTPQKLMDNPEGMYPYFSSGDRSFSQKVIETFDADDAVHFFASIGMLTEDKNDYVYPRSEQASSVLDILRRECERNGVDVVTEYEVSGIKVNTKVGTSQIRFEIDGKYSCRNLLLATGGQSAAKTGSDGSGYKLAKKLGHTIMKPRPSLCGIKCKEKFFKELAGVRNDSRITLVSDTKEKIIEAAGNLQFTQYGISGIPAFQISSELGRLLEIDDKAVIKIDMLPEISEPELIKFIDESGDETLVGVLNKKLASVVCKEAEKTKDRHIGETFGERVVPIIKRFKVTPHGLNSFEEAQTTAGGVSTAEINAATMESVQLAGLYIIGELIDVNGICGGYNLQWAWSTASIAADAIARR